MTTVSVPLPAHLEEFVANLARERSSNKAAVIRSAIERLAEEEAVQAVLAAQEEPTLHGELSDLVNKI